MEGIMKYRLQTMVAINLARAIGRADTGILPAMFKYVSRDFHANPAQMGTLTVCRGISQAVFAIIGGIAGHFINRTHVILYGCLIWAAMALSFAATRWVAHPLTIGCIIWAVNGFGVALVIPNAQSMTADYYKDRDFGKAFGVMSFSTSAGMITGSVVATNLAGIDDVGVFRGWQIVMLLVAVSGVVIGILNIGLAKEPRDKSAFTTTKMEMQRKWKDVWKGTLQVFRTPTFIILILQGVVGSVPWVAMGTFTTLYLQLIGMSNAWASVIYSSFLVGGALGSLLGGYLGDKAAQRWPKYGRIAVGQVSISLGVPLSVLIFRFLPRNGEILTRIGYMILMFAMGGLINWPVPACNNPVFADIVPIQHRNLIFSFDQCLEGGVSAPGGYLVGWAASFFFGYEGIATTSGDPDTDAARADALGQALAWISAVFWTLCVLFYSLMYFTYHKDRKTTTHCPLEASPLVKTGGEEQMD